MGVVKYMPEFVEQARKLCDMGATDLDLAKFFDVAMCTIRAWKQTYPEFGAALVVGKEGPDERVKRSLYQRAVGYNFESEKIFLNRHGEPVKVPTIEHVPPDVVACIFWSKNRMPEQFRDVKAVEWNGTMKHKRTEEMTDAEIDARLAELDRERARLAAGAKKPAAGKAKSADVH